MSNRKSAAEIDRMRRAGRVVGHTLSVVRAAARPGATLTELDALAEDTIRTAGAVPSFLGYHGYPATLCLSPNDRVVHGIPNGYELRDGDVLSIDCGAIVEGYHGDAAITVGVGTVDETAAALIASCEEALWAGIHRFRAGGRLSDIGHAVEQVGRKAGYGVVRDYVGHGIGTQMHEEPQVPNYGPPGQGRRLTVGMVLAIEPMLNEGSDATRVLEDGWTVVTLDGRRSAHFEHTVALTAEGPEVLTLLDDARESRALPGAPEAVG